MADGPSKSPSPHFDEPFPLIERAEFRWKETGAGVFEDGRGHRLNPSELVKCSNPRCDPAVSGFNAADIVSEMAVDHATDRAMTRRCGGYERPGPRGVGRNCSNSFQVEVTITYRETS
jgi:hypothetical protein